jgi:carbon-monoxide dehydrogenase medium subunit
MKPDTVEEALDALASIENAKVLAGGQSLIAALNLRLASPDCLVDINGLPNLSEPETDNGTIVLRSLVRHATVARSKIIAEQAPLLKLAVSHVAHPAIRNRGTTCGSIANADPASEMAACAVALNATLVLLSRKYGRREISARDFFRGIYETDCKAEELLLEVRLPIAHENEIFGFDEIARRHGDFALVGIAARASIALTKIVALDMVLFGSEPKPMLSAQAASIAQGATLTPDLIAELADAISVESDPMDGQEGGPEVRRFQTKSLVRRVLTDMMERSSVSGG